MATIPNDPLALAAGDLCHLITILAPTTTTDVSGTVLTYSTFATTRAKIDAPKGNELIRSGQQVTQTDLTITIRWQPGITSQMRIQTPSGLMYEILDIDNILERNRVLKLMCLGLGANQ